ncbi:MAG: hypothetical protein SPJ92_08395 [Bariatricus sp.]|nr:hypothetical protein [Bariatricus sp.]
MKRKRLKVLSFLCTATLMYSAMSVYAAESQEESSVSGYDLELDDINEAQEAIWNAAASDDIWTEEFLYYVQDGNVLRKDRKTEEIIQVGEDFSSDVWNGKNHLIYESEMLYFTTLCDRTFSILVYDGAQDETSTIYTKTISQEAEQTDDFFGQMYLIGKYKEDIVYYDNTDQNTDLVVIQEDDAKELLRVENYQGGYVTVDSDILIVSPGESVSDGELYAYSLEDGEEIKLSDRCRISSSGNYISNHIFFYLDITGSLEYTYDFVGFDLETLEEVCRISLGKGVWNTWNGCFVSSYSKQLLLYDGTLIPFSYDTDSLYRLDDGIFYCSEEMVLYQLDEEKKTWEVWVDLKDYDITFPYSQVYSTKISKTDAGIVFWYADESYQRHAVLLDGVVR